jgi:hypothetical protein
VTDARWLAWLCANFDILRRLDPAAAEDLLTAVRAGADRTDRLIELARDLDLPVEDDPRRTSDTGPAVMPGVIALVAGRPSREVVVCPGGRCGRTAVRRSGRPVPFCPIDGGRMHLARA